MAKNNYDCPPDHDEYKEMKRLADKARSLIGEEPEYEDHFEFMQREQMNIDSSTPELLFANGMSYFKWNKDNPITSKRRVQVGKDAGKEINVEHSRPLTIKGLCMHCNITEEYLADVKNSKDQDNPFYIVVKKLLYVIHTQNVEGAMVGLFESGFTMRVLNMEKEEAPTSYIKVERIDTKKELAESENEILQKLDSETEDYED